MSGFVGTRQLLVLVARLERVRLAVWVAVLGLLPVMVGSSFAALYGTAEERIELVGTVSSAPALVALLGPVNGFSVGALVSWRVGAFGAVMVALMAAFTVLRHTRLAEETGRAELLGSTVVGRYASLLAAVLAAVAAGAVIAVLAAGGLIGIGEDAAGAAAFGTAWFGVAVLFAVVGALTAQLTESARAARGLVGASVGVAFALRMVADGGADRGLGWLGWLSPIGWTTRMQAFGDVRWAVAALFAVTAVVVAVVVRLLVERRDLGAGLLATRLGPPQAADGLASPFGLARRLDGRGLVGWSVGVVVFGLVWGVLAETMTALLDENPQLADIIELVGGADVLTDAFFNAAFGLLGIVGAAYAIGAVLRLRDEETSGRVEPLLATPVSRLSWAGSHIVFALLGPVLLMGLAGAVTGLAYGATIDDLGGPVGRTFMQALLQVPAIWVIAGVALLLYGLAPRAAGGAWGVLVVALLLGQLGGVLQLPGWALDLSPFSHVPMSVGGATPAPLLWLTAAAAALLAAGLAALRRRDLG